ncbi:MAG: hypothetical protein K5799_00125 [Erythrobacter sp.]|nr:hypothetical protein [Erythrobacter sp.]
MKERAIASDYAAAGALLSIFDGREMNEVHSFTLQQLQTQFSFNLNEGFDYDRTVKVVKTLQKLGLGEFYEDPFADPIFQVGNRAIYNFLVDRSNVGDIYGRAWNLGVDWLKTAFENSHFWEEFDREPHQLAGIVVPKREDVYPFDHNSAAYKEAKDLIDELLSSLRTGNDVGQLSAQDVVEATGKVESLRDDLEDPNTSSYDLVASAKDVLSWIGKQAAGAVVGALSISLLIAIVNLVSVPF